MYMKTDTLRKKLAGKGLRVTPQRMIVYEAILKLNNHPTAEKIAEFVQKYHPSIAVGTIYKVLEALMKNGLISRVKTDDDVMRYDGITEPHHHLYCSESNRIEDYNDKDLCRIIADHFSKKKIPYFDIEDIKLQIIGKFIKK